MKTKHHTREQIYNLLTINVTIQNGRKRVHISLLTANYKIHV